ncbi:hypothetical protein A3Q56_02528 [Intoshia linei]|uniref:Uncharacterized protein n=1 Tax=Intoshia linei TaxID=1819745 RepID=A0A177B7S7_9BILA|nr:hypothetical protein A3Q56_02528 [Intoshia linei]
MMELSEIVVQVEAVEMVDIVELVETVELQLDIKEFLSIKNDDYSIIFNNGATSGLKMIAECFVFAEKENNNIIDFKERYAFLFHTTKSVNDRIDLISDELIFLWKKCRIKTITKNSIKLDISCEPKIFDSILDQYNNSAEESNFTSDSMENNSNLLYPHNMSVGCCKNI